MRSIRSIAQIILMTNNASQAFLFDEGMRLYLRG